MPATTVSARIDADLKRDAERVMERIGLTHSAAINAFYSQIVLRQGMPFELAIPGSDGKPLHDFHFIRSTVRRLAKDYGIAKVSLFGSYARGDAREDSDVDLLVSKGDAKGFALGGFQFDLSQALGKEVDVVVDSAADEAFLNRIKDDLVVLYER